MSDETTLDKSEDTTLDSLLDELDDTTPESEDMSGRDPVDVAKIKLQEGAQSALEDKATLVKEVVEGLIPDSVRTDIDTASEKVFELSNYVNQTTERAKRALSPITAKLEQHKDNKYIGKLVEMLQVNDDNISSGYREPTVEEQAADYVKSTLADNESVIIDTAGMQSTLDALKEIYVDINRIKNFHNNVTNVYYRKSLELQYRQVLYNKEMISILKDSKQTFITLLEAIGKNTSLPDFVKMTNTERMQQLLRNRYTEAATNTVFGDMKWVDNLFKNTVGKAAEYANNIVDNLDYTLGMVGSMPEVSGAEAAQMAGEESVKSLAGLAGKVIKGVIGKDKRLTELGAKAEWAYKDLPSYLKHTAEDKEGVSKTILNKLSSLLGSEQRFSTLQVDSINDLSPTAATPFDMYTKRSIVSVIPRLLSKIHQELYTLRTGKKVELSYDYKSDSLVDLSKKKDRVLTELKEKQLSHTGQRNIAEIANSLGMYTKNDKSKTELVNVVTDHVINNKGFNEKILKSDDFYKHFSEDVREDVKKSIDKYLSIYGSANASDLYSNYVEASASIQEIKPIIEQYVDAGYRDALLAAGIVKLDSRGRLFIPAEVQEELTRKSMMDYYNKEGKNVSPLDWDVSPDESPITDVILKAKNKAEKLIKDVDSSLHVSERVGEAKNFAKDQFEKITDKQRRKEIKETLQEQLSEIQEALNVKIQEYGDKSETVQELRKLREETFSRLKRFDKTHKISSTYDNFIKSARDKIDNITKNVDLNAKAETVQNTVEESITKAKDKAKDIVTNNPKTQPRTTGDKFKEDTFYKEVETDDVETTTPKLFTDTHSGMGVDNDLLEKLNQNVEGIHDTNGRLLDAINKMVGITTNKQPNNTIQPTGEVTDKYNSDMISIVESIRDKTSTCCSDTLSKIKDIITQASNIDKHIIEVISAVKGIQVTVKLTDTDKEVVSESDMVRSVESTSKSNSILDTINKKIENNDILKSMKSLASIPIKAAGNVMSSMFSISKNITGMFKKVGEYGINIFKALTSPISLLKELTLGNMIKLTTGSINGVRNVLRNTKNIGRGILKAPVGLVKSGLSRLMAEPMDVYIPGKDEPVLRATLFKMGYYRDADSGKVLKDPYDIKGTVVDSEGNVVLSIQDLQNGLFTKDGKEIKIGSIQLFRKTASIYNKSKSVIGRLMKIPSKSASVIGKVLAYPFKKSGMLIDAKIQKYIGSNVLGNIEPGSMIVTKELSTVGNGIYSKLDQIHKLLDERIAKPKHIRKGSWKERLEKEKLKKADDKVTTPTGKNTLKSTMGKASDFIKAKLGALLGFGSKDKDDDSSLVSDVTTGIGALAAGKLLWNKAFGKSDTALPSKAKLTLGMKSGSKVAGKALGKAALKKIPVLGVLAGLGFGLSRLLEGDVKGAGLEVASGVTGSVPGLGTAASVGIDAYLAKHDMDKATINDSTKPQEDEGFFSELWSKTKKVLGIEDPVEDDSTGEEYTHNQFSKYVILGKNVNIDKLNPKFKQILHNLAKEYYEKTGKKLHINSGFRSTELQKRLYSQNPGKAAKPGHSLHNYGLAVDIDSKDVDMLDNLGLLTKYGLVRPVGGETWHVEPIGIQLDLDRAKQDKHWAIKAIEEGLGKGGGGIGSSRYTHGRNLATIKAILEAHGGIDTVSTTPKSTLIAGVESKLHESKPMTADTKVGTFIPASKDNGMSISDLVPDKRQGIEAGLHNASLTYGPSVVRQTSVEKATALPMTTLSSMDDTLKSSLEVQQQILTELSTIRVQMFSKRKKDTKDNVKHKPKYPPARTITPPRPGVSTKI